MIDSNLTILRLSKWLREYWQLLPLIIVSILFYWVLWLNVYAIIASVILVGITISRYNQLHVVLKRYWPVLVILLIISISMWIRLVGFYTPDGTRWEYLRNIDSYFFLRHIDDVLQVGYYSGYDHLMNAPFGQSVGGVNLYFYFGAYSYMLYNLFNPTALEQFLIWFPALLASLLVIPMYYIGKTLFDRKAGVLAAIFMVFSVSFISRSLGGDPDSDGIVMLVAMASIAAFLIFYKYLNTEKIFARRNIIWSVITAVLLAIFACTWSGYFFVFVIILGFVIVKIILDLIRTKNLRKTWSDSRSLIVNVIIILVVFWILTVPFFGLEFISSFITTPVTSLGASGGLKAEAGHFPNVAVSIAELMSGGQAGQVIVSASGLDTAASVSGIPVSLLFFISPFLLMVVCILYLLYSYYKKRKHLDTLVFLGIWFFGFVFASVIAVRFTIFLAPVYAIGSAIAISKVWRLATSEDNEIGD
ncbi:MAG: STT3 domain-containing protein [Candidatus Aenigmatarchaeota archaeon]